MLKFLKLLADIQLIRYEKFDTASAYSKPAGYESPTVLNVSCRPTGQSLKCCHTHRPHVRCFWRCFSV